MTDEELEEIILEPDPDRVMQGLRDTGYDFNTAIADIVDNSIAAGASKVAICVNMDPMGEVGVYIADNGSGMNFKGLKNAMRYGSDVRPDPSSLGKFGLGLKTASTAFCRSLSLMSKGEDGKYRKVQWNLDEIAKLNKWKLLTPPLDESEIDLIKSTAGEGTGTLVIWEKVDRLLKFYSKQSAAQKALSKTVENLCFHLSMVYQRFLDRSFENVPNVEILLNDEEVLPWDPFCKDEPKTELLAQQNIEVVLPNDSESSFNVEAYMIPSKYEYASDEGRKRARISNDLQGFFIYRENRLIYHGGWMNMFTKEPHGSLLRVSFSFDNTMDEAFNVDIKKSRIMLSDEIFNYLKDSFLPAPRRAADERYRKGTNQQLAGSSKNAHDASNQNISAKAASVEESKVEVVNSDTGEVKISNSNGTFTGKIVIKNSEKSGQCRVVPSDDVEAGMLWKPGIVDGQHAVLINTKHPYYQKVYAPVLDNSVLVTGMDALLWALSESELSTYNEETKEQYEDMRVNVARILKKLVADLPDPGQTEE